MGVLFFLVAIACIMSQHGGVPKWLKGLVLKTGSRGNPSESSNPSASATPKNKHLVKGAFLLFCSSGYSEGARNGINRNWFSFNLI